MKPLLNVYILNLPNRQDRLGWILKQYENRSEFNINVVIPYPDVNPKLSLWLTLRQIVEKEITKEDDFFIFCEDDHQFTEQYSPEYLWRCIDEAIGLKADVLSGGISWQRNSIEVSENLFWIERFSGLQFVIIFREFYSSILSATFSAGDAADYKISEIGGRKFVTYPFVSTQKEFGYSDVTPVNRRHGRVNSLFEQTNLLLNYLKKVKMYYAKSLSLIGVPDLEFGSVNLPVFIIDVNNRTEEKLLKQFHGRDEFNVTIVRSFWCDDEHEKSWKSIGRIIRIAIRNEEDFVILCENDHSFTEHYNRDSFIKCIIESYLQRADMMVAGISDFGMAVPLSRNKFWVDRFLCAQFVVVYKQFYQKILSYNFREGDAAGSVLSKLSNNKVALYPFMSVPQDFGYPGAINPADERKGNTYWRFRFAHEKFSVYRSIYEEYYEE